MAGEHTCAILPCPDLDEAVGSYEALGFARTYRQLRPDPHAVVALEDIAIHLSGIDGFDPTTSVGSVIVTVADADALHAAFADGLRRVHGRLPSTGVPRILRLRRRQGTATGLSVVDPGGNWLRPYRAREAEDDPAVRSAPDLAHAREVLAPHP